MLNKNALASDLQAVFDDLSDTSQADRLGAIGDAIVAYLGDAVVGMPPAGTMSGVTFPGATAIPSLVSAQGPPSVASAAIFANAIATAVTAGTAASLGGLDGVPMPPGVQIVTEIGLPPIMPVILLPFSDNQSSADAANAIADAIHNSVGTILFNIIELVPTPAGPIPTPMPPAQIK